MRRFPPWTNRRNFESCWLDESLFTRSRCDLGDVARLFYPLFPLSETAAFGRIGAANLIGREFGPRGIGKVAPYSLARFTAVRAPSLFGPPREFVGDAFRTLVSSPSSFVVVYRPLHFPCTVFTHFCDGTRAFLRGFPQFRIGSNGRHAETILCRIPKPILQKMVSISSKPLPPTIMKHINMDELRRLEAANAVTTQMLKSKPKSMSSERLKQLRRAVVKHSKKLRSRTSSMERARTSSEKRAKKEASRRRTIYNAKKRPGSPSKKKLDDLAWYNQPYTFYRGSPSRRRRRSKRSRRPRGRSSRR